ncbi:hypothetical protein GUITHDRAFT_120544 [Guillardia theta CCMP2712]|uniref:Uncharacterized protein n=1 Tax=Guillardia theta (strain CCMP2712) TaxID=905079 RepID=L1IBK8_GUITC|nr:hypothetical protein GUITHDRAFT_120544 [Guillardia theta CCMP2712]EKX33279.1 hypothetical protein GUITHDRAFT_120544 [Guillardia theta CCMP2712]|eukprot:XP_005820259.1 hypothetical protein GUITHDRAFT_120544 [Guillardia theta CCMP2712]
MPWSLSSYTHIPAPWDGLACESIMRMLPAALLSISGDSGDIGDDGGSGDIGFDGGSGDIGDDGGSGDIGDDGGSGDIGDDGGSVSELIGTEPESDKGLSG